jgi:hypothetical protein
MEQRRSTGWPILLGIVLIGSILALGVGWVLVSIAAAFGSGNAAFYWVILGVGVALLVLLLVGVIVYLFLTVKAIALSQRQSNFIDSVTHELKSPLASLKLYLQTLNRHQVSAEQQADFHRFMLKDVERLDTLIDHLLDAAKTQKRARGDEQGCELEPILRAARDGAAVRYGIDPARISIQPFPAEGAPRVRGRSADLEIVFRNLVDNAVKYSMPDPRVEIETERPPRGRHLLVRVIDNGPGIPPAERTQVFGRFVRLGKELERSTPGTGLGLYLVKSIVGQLRGRVTITGRGAERGTVMEVRLPAG